MREAVARQPERFLNRELSWLEFNARVLEEAQDEANPLLERLKFACIVASNFDEFFMVRVAALKNALAEGDVGPDAAGLTPAQQLHCIAERSHAIVDDLYAALHGGILPGLAERGPRLVTPADLPPPARAALARYHRDEVMPALTPLAIDASRPFPMLAGLSLNLAVLLAPAGGEGEERLAVVQVPGRLRRLVRPPESEESVYVLLVDIIRSELGTLFPGQEIRDAAAFRVARDSELDLDDEGGLDFLHVIEEELKNRRRSEVVRLEVEDSISEPLLSLLSTRLVVGPEDTYRVRGPVDIRPLMKLVDLPALEDLRHSPLKPQPTVTETGEALFALLDERDVVLHHPYDSFDPVVSFVSSAAADPDVLAIKQTLYRTSGDSPVVRALARAAESGKQVTVLVELLARFDEQSNIRWARALEESGCHVIYGIRGFKTHSKICLVVRRGRAGIRRYVHLGTGNYNEQHRAAVHRLRPDDVRPGDRRGRLVVLQRPHRVLGPAEDEEAGHGPHPVARAVPAPDRPRARSARWGAARRDPGQDELPRRRGDDPGPLRGGGRGSADPPLRPRDLRPAPRGSRAERVHRGGVDRRPLPRALADLPLPQRRRRGGLPLQRGLDAPQPESADRAALPGRGPRGRQKVLRALDAAFRDDVKARILQSDGRYLRRPRRPGEPPFRSQVELHRDARRAAQRARAASGLELEPLASPEG